MSWERTYQIEAPPEPAMRWEEYERLILAEWDALLRSDPAPNERKVQTFFEQHPSLVPGAFNLLGNQSGHYPWLSGLISRPPLPSYDRRIPDFMWISLNSEAEEPVLIEIEAPGKRWFTGSGQQTAHLTEALNQIAEWKAWFGIPHNVEAFKAFYGLDREAGMRRRFRPAYLLIYGRRAEANANPSLTQKRGHLHPDDVVVMTYDRLRPNSNASQLLCMKVERERTFRALSVPATLKWSPSLAEDRALLVGLEAAIDLNPYISSVRKQFLIRRLPYWSEWASRGNKGVISSGDEE
jgi:hypothetical protein